MGNLQIVVVLHPRTSHLNGPTYDVVIRGGSVTVGREINRQRNYIQRKQMWIGIQWRDEVMRQQRKKREMMTNDRGRVAGIQMEGHKV